MSSLLRLACLTGLLLGVLSVGQPLEAAAASEATVAPAQVRRPVSALQRFLSQREAVCFDAVSPRGPGLLLSGPTPRELALPAPAWRQAAAVAATQVPHARAGARLGCLRVRQLRATLSPNAP